MCYNWFMATSTWNHSSRETYCDAHDVSGCQVVECRAIRLGVSVERYHALVTRPVQRSIAAQDRRTAARREVLRDWRD